MSRPRLLYFNGPWDFLGERMRQSFIEPMQALLARDFDVISLAGNRDFKAEVETHQPDMVLFHTGCEAPAEPSVAITNTDAFPDLPRLGYIYRDPFSPSRVIAMNRLRQWGVHQVVTAFRPSDAPSPYFAETLYLPFWIDPELFKDYGEERTVPISLTGAGWFNKCIYQWRAEIAGQLVPRFPVFHAPSLGNRQSNHDFVGESYARLLNRSLFSAGCGSVNRYLTLKLLEIPAARTCLIAEEIDVLKAAGFRDGVNCVFATPQNVGAKVQTLLDDPAKLAAITDAGYALVRSRHTAAQRRVFIEWYELWQKKAPSQRIVQPDPFGALRLAEANAKANASSFPTENPLIANLLQAYKLMGMKRWPEALKLLDNVIAIVPCIAEARLGAALCHMRLGTPAKASPHFGYNLQLLTQHFGYAHPDAIDMAFTAVLCLRMGDRNTARQLLKSHAQVRHPALNAMRWMFARLESGVANQAPFNVSEGDETCTVETVHLLQARPFETWVKTFESYLRAA